jgi:hypothetical protein
VTVADGELIVGRIVSVGPKVRKATGEIIPGMVEIALAYSWFEADAWPVRISWFKQDRFGRPSPMQASCEQEQPAVGDRVAITVATTVRPAGEPGAKPFINKDPFAIQVLERASVAATNGKQTAGR